jgi:hypothetical protein
VTSDADVVKRRQEITLAVKWSPGNHVIGIVQHACSQRPKSTAPRLPSPGIACCQHRPGRTLEADHLGSVMSAFTSLSSHGGPGSNVQVVADPHAVLARALSEPGFAVSSRSSTARCRMSKQTSQSKSRRLYEAVKLMWPLLEGMGER